MGKITSNAYRYTIQIMYKDATWVSVRYSFNSIKEAKAKAEEIKEHLIGGTPLRIVKKTEREEVVCEL